MTRRILIAYKQGYLFDRIAKDEGCSVDDVLETLVDAGIIQLQMVELRKANGR